MSLLIDILWAPYDFPKEHNLGFVKYLLVPLVPHRFLMQLPFSCVCQNLNQVQRSLLILNTVHCGATKSCPSDQALRTCLTTNQSMALKRQTLFNCAGL